MSNPSKNLLVLTAGITIGAVSTFFLTKKALAEQFERDLTQQIQEVKDYYKLLRKEAPYDTPEQVQEINYQELIDSYKNDTKDIKAMQEEIESEDVYEEEFSEDVETEEPIDKSKPYIISIGEFMSETEWEKMVVTYFELDDVLVDDREVVISNVDSVIGSDALTKFGHKSKDANVVYVRNEELEADYEVVRDPRSYSEVILGFKEEKEVLRMREDD
jgi:hypothetical protein